jgi:hypothetical protein
MSGCVVYVCHPLERYVPGIAAAVSAAIVAVTVLPEWAKSSVRVVVYDANASLRVNDLCSQVLGKLGPVILLDPVQIRVFELLHERLGTRTTILRAGAYSGTEVIELLLRAKTIHESGEPHLCRYFVIALLLLRKLDQERMWSGNAKGYMWYDDIPKGRGLDEEFSDAVPMVLSLLLQHGLLVQKTSRSSNKYALNPERREEIYTILRARRFADQQLTRVLERDRRVVSCRELDLLDCYVEPPARA